MSISIKDEASKSFSKKAILVYLDSFLNSAGIEQVNIDIQRFEQCFSDLNKTLQQNFNPDGYVSPFKAAASLIAVFIKNSPIRTPFPKEAFGDFVEIPNHQNIIPSIALALDSLNGALLEADRGIKLTNRIKMSRHFYTEIIQALSCQSSHVDVRTLALLLESLAYQTNPEVAYESMSEPDAGGNG